MENLVKALTSELAAVEARAEKLRTAIAVLADLDSPARTPRNGHATRKPPPPPAAPRRTGRGGPANAGVCGVCHERGHNRRTCPKKGSKAKSDDDGEGHEAPVLLERLDADDPAEEEIPEPEPVDRRRERIAALAARPARRTHLPVLQAAPPPVVPLAATPDARVLLAELRAYAERPVEPMPEIPEIGAYRCHHCGVAGHGQRTCPMLNDLSPLSPPIVPVVLPARRQKSTGNKHGRWRRSLGDPRARTEAPRRMSREMLRLGTLLYPMPEDAVRPKTRADCVDGSRPCPWVGCRYHLYLDVNPQTGSLKLNFPHKEPDELAQTCALDVADQPGHEGTIGHHTLERVAELVNLTRERVRQVEIAAAQQLRVTLEAQGYAASDLPVSTADADVIW